MDREPYENHHLFRLIYPQWMSPALSLIVPQCCMMEKIKADGHKIASIQLITMLPLTRCGLGCIYRHHHNNLFAGQFPPEPR